MCKLCASYSSTGVLQYTVQGLANTHQAELKSDRCDKSEA